MSRYIKDGYNEQGYDIEHHDQQAEYSNFTRQLEYSAPGQSGKDIKFTVFVKKSNDMRIAWDADLPEAEQRALMGQIRHAMGRDYSFPTTFQDNYSACNINAGGDHESYLTRFIERLSKSGCIQVSDTKINVPRWTPPNGPVSDINGPGRAKALAETRELNKLTTVKRLMPLVVEAFPELKSDARMAGLEEAMGDMLFKLGKHEPLVKKGPTPK